jgi:hypothetical protein
MNHNEQAKKVWASGHPVKRAIGFGMEEQRRLRTSTEPKYINWFPLVEWGWDREMCIKVIKRHFLSIPMKSACFFCPASKKPEVVKLKLDHPELYDRAIAMEKNAELTTIKGLGRNWSWQSTEGSQPHIIEQTCMCFDGDDD